MTLHPARRSLTNPFCSKSLFSSIIRSAITMPESVGDEFDRTSQKCGHSCYGVHRASAKAPALFRIFAPAFLQSPHKKLDCVKSRRAMRNFTQSIALQLFETNFPIPHTCPVLKIVVACAVSNPEWQNRVKGTFDGNVNINLQGLVMIVGIFIATATVTMKGDL